MKWILVCVLSLAFVVNADARPHLRGKLRGWLQHRNHPVRHHRDWGKKHKTVCPGCGCNDGCKCGPCLCGPVYKCSPKCPCGKENILYKHKK